MSSFDRRSLLILPLALAACGFQPVYGPGGTGSALFGRVAVSELKTVEGFLLVEDLEQRLGRSATSTEDFKLNVGVATRSQGQAITQANETTRYTITGQANYTLTRAADGAVVASGAVENFVGYSATGSTVETLAGERDARRRLMTILADQITNQLYATADLSA